MLTDDEGSMQYNASKLVRDVFVHSRVSCETVLASVSCRLLVYTYVYV